MGDGARGVWFSDTGAPHARGAAALIVSAYEGALVQARVAGTVQAMRDTSEALVGLLRLALGGRNTPNT